MTVVIRDPKRVELAPTGELQAAITAEQYRSIVDIYKAGNAPLMLLACVLCISVCWDAEDALLCACCQTLRIRQRKGTARGHSGGAHVRANLREAMASIPRRRAA